MAFSLAIACSRGVHVSGLRPLVTSRPPARNLPRSRLGIKQEVFCEDLPLTRIRIARASMEKLLARLRCAPSAWQRTRSECASLDPGSERRHLRHRDRLHARRRTALRDAVRRREGLTLEGPRAVRAAPAPAARSGLGDQAWRRLPPRRWSSSTTN